MLSVKEKMIKESIFKLLGDTQEADLIFKQKTGKITQEEIDQYHRQREEETQYFKEFFQFDKPQLPSVFDPEPNQPLIISHTILKDSDGIECNEIRGNEMDGDKDALSLNEKQ
jgi:hypothetical protein